MANASPEGLSTNTVTCLDARENRLREFHRTPCSFISFVNEMRDATANQITRHPAEEGNCFSIGEARARRKWPT